MMKLWLLLCALLLWTAPAQAVTLIAESGFEGANPEADGWGYTNSYCTSSPCAFLDVSTDVAHAGSKSLKGTYNAAWSDPNPQINTVAIFKDFIASTEVYNRYWYRTTAFTYTAASGTKHIYWRKNQSDAPDGFSINWFGSRTMGYGMQGIPNQNCTTGALTPPGTRSCNYYPNMASRPLADGVWYCIEEHVKLNDIGQANGSLEMWVDGTQTVGYYNKTWRSNANAAYSRFNIYKQNGDGLVYFDQFMAATTRIGCGGAPPPPQDTTSPATPIGLGVQ